MPRFPIPGGRIATAAMSSEVAAQAAPAGVKPVGKLAVVSCVCR
jgi:hypothetical protein